MSGPLTNHLSELLTTVPVRPRFFCRMPSHTTSLCEDGQLVKVGCVQVSPRHACNIIFPAVWSGNWATEMREVNVLVKILCWGKEMAVEWRDDDSGSVSELTELSIDSDLPVTGLEEWETNAYLMIIYIISSIEETGNTVRPLKKDHPDDRPPLLCDNIFFLRPFPSYVHVNELLTKDQTSCNPFSTAAYLPSWQH